MDYESLSKEKLIYMLREATTLKNGITNSNELAEQLIAEYGTLNQEHYVVILFDTKLRILEKVVLNIGTLNSSIVDRAALGRLLLSDPKCSAFITCHNHPSGSLAPSQDDTSTRKVVRSIAELFGIRYLDDFIVSCEGYWSASEEEHCFF